MAELPSQAAPAPRLSIRIVLGDAAMLGPGKADLLERIRETGSIAAAGRSMSMSYKRAWMLVEELNRVFREPLVASTRGGAKGGGARLTEAGETVLSNYRRLEEIMAEAGAARIGVLRSMLREAPGYNQPPAVKGVRPVPGGETVPVPPVGPGAKGRARPRGGAL